MHLQVGVRLNLQIVRRPLLLFVLLAARCSLVVVAELRAQQTVAAIARPNLTALHLQRVIVHSSGLDESGVVALVGC